MSRAISNDTGGTGPTPFAPTRAWVRQGVSAAFVLAVLPGLAHALPPDHVPAWTNRGLVAPQGVHYAAVGDATRETVPRTPPEAITWYNLGLAHVTGGRYPEAIEALREAVRLHPDYADAWQALGLAYAKLARSTDAIAAYREAVRLNPT